MSDELRTLNGGAAATEPPSGYKPFHKIYSVQDPNEREPGGPAPGQPWEVVDRADSVAGVLYVKGTREVVLRRRFRAGPALRAERTDHDENLLLETLAAQYSPPRTGDHGQALRKAALELFSSVGYRGLGVDDVRRVISVYASPGGSSERIHFFFAVAEGRTTAQRPAYKALHVDVRRFLAAMDDAMARGDAVDMKLLIGVQELRRWLSYADAAALA